VNKRLLFLLPLAVFVVLAVYLAIGLTRDPSVLPSVLIDQKVPDFELSPIKGYERGLTSADLKGQVSLVNIFGSWCIACQVEHPFLMKIKGENRVPLYGVDWREKTPDDGPDWLNKMGDPYTLIGDDPESKGAIAFGVYGAPETLIIDENGVIRYKQVGPMDDKIWEEAIWPIIRELRKRRKENERKGGQKDAP
jgi:cytochrome c biogenesis protein CcmG/thiol:disulfide interchange protein DsbE